MVGLPNFDIFRDFPKSIQFSVMFGEYSIIRLQESSSQTVTIPRREIHRFKYNIEEAPPKLKRAPHGS